MAELKEPHVSITPLLKRLWPDPHRENVTPAEIALAISRIFTDSLSPVQTGALLTALHFTGLDQRAEVIARCAEAMRRAASPVDCRKLEEVVKRKRKKRGGYHGGLCDIVGTGGDAHSTFNVSTTSSIIASSYLLIAKHGNRAATSKSGSADVLMSMKPQAANISAITPSTIASIYQTTNYAFLYAPVFHPGMTYVATVRRELGWRTIFNLLGPLANPIEELIEARIVGVARRDLGPTFAEALKMGGAKKGMVVCGAEDLDEISCAGETYCWRLFERPNPGRTASEEDDTDEEEDEHNPKTVVDVEHFILSPSDFGLPAHPLSEVAPGRLPEENAVTLSKMLRNELPPDDPVLHFVYMNTAALLVVSGICDDPEVQRAQEESEEGPGRGKWKRGVSLARQGVEEGLALREWEAYVNGSNSFSAD